MGILAVLYIIVPVGQLAVYLAGREALDPANALNFGASILCLHWMLAQTLVASKVPVLQRHLPYDARIRFHILASSGILVTLAYHGAYKILEGREIDLISWLLLAGFGLMMTLALLWVPVVGRVLRNQALSYDRHKSVHGWVQLALTTLLFLHIAGSGMFDEVPIPSALLYYLQFAGTLGLFILSKSGIFHVGATVQGIEASKGILRVHLTPDRKPRYRSGQFAFLQAAGPRGWKEDHPFSFLSAPHDPTVSFAIRAKGDFTRGLGSLRPGDRVRINGGYGNFRPQKERGLCFVSSGIGSVPFVSILKELHAAGDRRPVQFHLSVDHQDEIPDRERIQDLAAQMPNVTLRILERPRGKNRYSAGYFLRETGNPLDFSYYLCSSPGVQAEVFTALRSLGVPRNSIRWEAFALG